MEMSIQEEFKKNVENKIKTSITHYRNKIKG